MTGCAGAEHDPGVQAVVTGNSVLFIYRNNSVNRIVQKQLNNSINRISLDFISMKWPCEIVRVTNPPGENQTYAYDRFCNLGGIG